MANLSRIPLATEGMQVSGFAHILKNIAFASTHTHGPPHSG